MIFVQTSNQVPLECIGGITGKIGGDNFLLDLCSTSDCSNQHFPEMWREISDLDPRLFCGSSSLDHVRVHASVPAFADVTHHALNPDFVYVRRQGVCSLSLSDLFKRLHTSSPLPRLRASQRCFPPHIGN